MPWGLLLAVSSRRGALEWMHQTPPHPASRSQGREGIREQALPQSMAWSLLFTQ